MPTAYEASGLARDRPWCPLPHFYEETWSYLNGNIRVLCRLPAAQASALRQARRSRTPVAQGQAETLAWMTNPSRETLGRVLSARDTASRRAGRRRTPRLPPVSETPGFLPFKEMVRREIPLTSSPPTTSSNEAASPGRRNAARPMPSTRRRETVQPQRPRPVYDGLRSSPYRGGSAGPHTWKPYSGPFWTAPEQPDQTNEQHPGRKPHHHATKQQQRQQPQQQPIPRKPIPTPSTPGLEQATLAIRTTPKLIHHPDNPNPTSPPPPVPAPAPAPAPTRPPKPHYTTPDGARTLAALRRRLQQPASQPAGQVLASLLLRWPGGGRAGGQGQATAAAVAANGVDWRGAEGGLAEGSFARRAVEGWIAAGQPPLFGEASAAAWARWAWEEEEGGEGEEREEMVGWCERDGDGDDEVEDGYGYDGHDGYGFGAGERFERRAASPLWGVGCVV